MAELAAGGEVPAPAPVAKTKAKVVAARQQREHELSAMRQEREDLQRTQRALTKRIKLEQKQHARALRRLKTVPSERIIQFFRERGEDV